MEPNFDFRSELGNKFTSLDASDFKEVIYQMNDLIEALFEKCHKKFGSKVLNRDECKRRLEFFFSFLLLQN